MIDYAVVGILYTRTCPLNCRHCIISSSPKETEKMRPETARALIEQVGDFTDTVCFTGGEPMLYYNELLPLIQQARALGLKVTMVTGCGWVSPAKAEIARERIEGLKEAGLSALCVSWDVYHEEYSPAEKALIVIEHAQQIGLPVTVRGVISADGAKPAIEEKLVQINVTYEKVDVIRLGHASTLPEHHFKFSDQVERGGCSTVLSPTVEPDGNVYACCGPSRSSKAGSPLVLGNVNTESLTEILARGTVDPVLEAIYRVGPYGLYHLLKDDPRFLAALPRRKQYTGICELCLDVCDTPAVVTQLRERLSQPDAQALLVAARLMQKAALTKIRPIDREGVVDSFMHATSTTQTQGEVYAH